MDEPLSRDMLDIAYVLTKAKENGMLLHDFLESLDYCKLRDKGSHLGRSCQEDFVKYLEDMYEQETHDMLQFIDESRAALRLTGYDIQSEQRALRDTAQELERGRTPDPRSASSRGSGSGRGSDRSRLTPVGIDDPASNYLRGRTTPNSAQAANFNYEVENKLAVERYMRQRERKEKKSRSRSRAYEDENIPGTPDSNDSYEVEKETIMKDMHGATARIENERERQMEMVRRAKEQKKMKQMQQAFMATEIVNQATEGEKRKMGEKERQEQLFREKLTEKKRQRELTLLSMGEPSEGKEPKEKEKKKKKKKDKDRDIDVEAGELADGDGEKKKKKKKKDKSKDRDLDDDAVEVDETGAEKKKKKKKKKEKDHGEELDENGEVKEKKKKKKKDKDRDRDE